MKIFINLGESTINSKPKTFFSMCITETKQNNNNDDDNNKLRKYPKNEVVYRENLLLRLQKIMTKKNAVME